jgi:hypothetical protein
MVPRSQPTLQVPENLYVVDVTEDEHPDNDSVDNEADISQ